MSKLFTELVAEYISSFGVGTWTSDTTIAKNIFVDTLPTSPLTCTAVIATGGPSDPSIVWRSINFQILHRNTSVTSGLAAITTIDTIFDKQWNVLCTVVSSNNPTGYIGRTYAATEPGIHWRDANGVVVFSQNFTLFTTQQS